MTVFQEVQAMIVTADLDEVRVLLHMALEWLAHEKGISPAVNVTVRVRALVTTAAHILERR